VYTDGFGGEFVFPDNFADLRDESVTDGAGGAGEAVDLTFGEEAVEFGLGWEPNMGWAG